MKSWSRLLFIGLIISDISGFRVIISGIIYFTWPGNKDEGRDYEEDGDDYAIVVVEKTQKKVESYPFLSDALREYWKSNGDKFSAVSLENGLTQMDTARARELEKKWKKQLEAEIRSRMKQHEVFKEVYALLIDGIKGQGL